MTRTDLEVMVNNHNNSIDTFIHNLLPQLLEMAGVKVTKKDDGNYEIPMSDWFTAQRFISAMDFYKSAMEILKPAREAGYDVKIDMQSNKLIIY